MSSRLGTFTSWGAQRLTPVAALGFVAVLVVASAAAAIFGGLSWLLYVATVGTAAGTLGLAYSTWSLASKTQEAVNAARADLLVAEKGVAAATRTADEAERTRVDAIAPLVDLSVTLSKALYTPPGGGVPRTTHEFPPNIPGGDVVTGRELEGADVGAILTVELINLGKTPGYFQFTHMGFLVNGADGLIRLPGGASRTFEGRLHWNYGPEDPAKPRQLELQAKVWGPMTTGVVDEISWEGEITLIRDFHGAGGGFQAIPEGVLTLRYNISRQPAHRPW